MEVRSRRACSRECFETAGCFGFDFTEGQNGGGGGLCLLHDAAAITVSVPQVVARGSESTQNFGM
jgi:hypothetical protein